MRSGVSKDRGLKDRIMGEALPSLIVMTGGPDSNDIYKCIQHGEQRAGIRNPYAVAEL